MTERPKKPFNLLARPDDEPLRDKDNAHPRHEPKIERKPAPNLAPGGALGIRRGLPSKDDSKAEKRFNFAKAGDLTRAFTPIARGGPDKSRDR